MQQFDFHTDRFWNEYPGMEIDAVQHAELKSLLAALRQGYGWRVVSQLCGALTGRKNCGPVTLSNSEIMTHCCKLSDMMIIVQLLSDLVYVWDKMRAESYKCDQEAI